MNRKNHFITLLIIVLLNASTNAQKIYLNFGSHNETEDPLDYYGSLSDFNIIKPIIRQIADTIIEKRAAWNMQVESNFIRAVLLHETGSSSTSDILEVLDTSEYIEVDPHNHFDNILNPYNYPDLTKLLEDDGLLNRKNMGGYIWKAPQEDWTQYQTPVPGYTYTTTTWSPEILWGGGSPGHTNDFNGHGIWKPQGPANILTFMMHQTSNSLTAMGNGCSNVIWETTSADSISNNIINLVNQIATGQISQTGFYTQTIMFNFKNINTTTAAGFVNKISEIIDDLQPYVDQGKIEWATLSQKHDAWNTLHANPNDFFVLQCSSIPTVYSTISASPSSLTSFSTTVGTPSSIESFSVSADWITSDLSITAPTDFEVSLSSTSGFTTSANISAIDGSFATTIVYARYNPSAAGSHSGNIVLSANGNSVTSQTVSVSGTSTDPSLTVTPNTLSSFSTTVGTPSSVNSFSVSGVGLSSNITITAPESFEVSLSSSSGFGTSVNITPTSGSVENVIVYARYNPSVAGTHNDNITVDSGTNSYNVSVYGTSADPVPYVFVSLNSLTTFTTTVGTPSSTQSFQVSGENLGAKITVTASTHFEVSTSAGSGFAPSLALTPISGTVDTTTIYVIYDPTSAGSHTGTVLVSSGGVATQTVSVSGSSTTNGLSEINVHNYNLTINPNPAKQFTSITWQLSKKESIQIELLDVKGRLVETILNKEMSAGEYLVNYDLKNLENGIYILRLTSGGNTTSKKIVKNAY